VVVLNSSLSVLACGGGSGRILQVEYDGDRLELRQVGRFPNGTVRLGDSLYWNILGVYKGLLDGLAKASSLGVRASAMGLDTWGNDFTLLDRKGFMLEGVHSYRDSRTEGTARYVDGIIPAFGLYSRNGIQQTRMNTLYQLISLVRDRPYLFEAADKFLFVPDLLAYFLTGEIYSEYTLATISQLYHYGKGGWDDKLMELLGIPLRLFPTIIQPGVTCGTMLPSVRSDPGIGSLPLISVGAHDTASAVVAVPEPTTGFSAE
jgi:rhamnulokinase